MNSPYPPYSPYPTDAFFKCMGDPLLEVNSVVQAPISMTALSFLSTMSAAVQRIADVQLPMGQVRPVSLFTLAIADSGERKTTLDELVGKPLRERDAVEERRFAEQLAKYEQDMERWQSTRTALIKRYSRLVEKGEATDKIEKKLAELDDAKPRPPRLRRLLRQDLTYAALIVALEGDGESTFISASEGDAALKSDLIQQNFTALSMAWSGESIVADRADKGRTAINPRCTLSVMVQNAVFNQFMEKRGDVLRGSGFLARCLITRPISMIGHRFAFSDPPQWKHLDAFHARLRCLLEEGDLRLAAGVPRHILEFDEEARHRWVLRANEVEVMLRDGNYFGEVRDFGAKLMEHVARVAAVLHVFAGQDGKITVDTTERAWTIVLFHAEEFRLMFSPSLEIPQAVVDAEKIERWLLANVWLRGFAHVLRNHVHRTGPVRGLGRFVPAIDVLVGQGKIFVTQANSKAPLVIGLNPNYFGVPHPGWECQNFCV